MTEQENRILKILLKKVLHNGMMKGINYFDHADKFNIDMSFELSKHSKELPTITTMNEFYNLLYKLYNDFVYSDFGKVCIRQSRNLDEWKYIIKESI